jgi:hypothetical protein
MREVLVNPLWINYFLMTYFTYAITLWKYDHKS